MKEKMIELLSALLILFALIFVWVFAYELTQAILLSLFLLLIGILLYIQKTQYQSKIQKQIKRHAKSYASLKNNTINITQFIALSDVIDRGLLLVDHEGVIKHVNALFQRYFDVKVHIETSFTNLKTIKPLYKVIQESLIHKTQTRIQVDFENQHFDINTTPIMNDQTFQGTIVIVHDITQLKTAETFQKQFTADVSHELKTPLTTIKGLAEILTRSDDVDGTAKRDFIKVIHEESTRMETILSDLLIISKMDRLDYELKLEKTDIKALIENVLSLVDSQAKEKKITIKTSLESQELYIDSTKIKQVMLNLVKNALNYTDSGSITLMGKRRKDVYTIDIIDTGIGIPLAEQEKVFKRFYRLDEARSRASGGSGLGLSIIKNVVKKHQGTIRLTSEIGVGSHFSIDLPVEHQTP